MAREKTKSAGNRIGPSQFDAKRLGAAVRVLRADRGLNPSQFAKLIGMTRQAVAVLEKGSVEPSISTLEKVASATGLSIIEVLAMGVVADGSIDPKIQSVVGVLRRLDDRSRDLAASLLTALSKHRIG